MTEALEAAVAVVGYWDALDAVGAEDPRPTDEFATEMARRVDRLRAALRIGGAND